ncbi:MAG: DUF4832 domain-containing protein [Lachnospiraceae bacterium]|nr:DUF4832 domain-containing protein [Lachnospiraceae bacterium]
MYKLRRSLSITAAILILAATVFLPAPQGIRAEENAPVTIDGNGEDWNYITPVYSGGGVIRKLSAFTEGGTLYGKMELSSAGNFDTWHIYFETDGDTSNHLYHNGADYVLETDILYVYEGDSGEWEGLVGTTAPVADKLSDDRKTLEFSFPVSELGDPEQIGIRAATVYNWEDVAANPEQENVYLQIPSYEEVQSEEMTGLTEEEAEAYFASKQFSGTPNQWDSILYDAVFSNSNLISLKAVCDGENLYIHAKAKALSNNFTVFIRTDKAEYLLKANGVVYTAKDGKAIDTGTPAADFFKADTGFEASIPLSVFAGNTDTFEIALDDEGERLPDDAEKMLKVTAPIMEDAPKITPDGDASDWQGIAAIGKGEGSLGDLYAVRTPEGLYAMTTIKEVEDPESSAAYTTSLFIGTDNNDETGFIHEGYAEHRTGDVLVQDWYSYGPDRNLEIFYTEEGVSLEWNMKKQYVEGYRKEIGKTGQDGTFCAEYFVPQEVLEEVAPVLSDDLYICIDRNDCQTDEETFERLTPEGFTPMRDPENGSFAKVPKYKTKPALDLKDSDLSDWDRIAVGAKHENKVNLMAVRSDRKLYTMITGNGDLSTDHKYYIATDADGYTFDGREHVSYYIEDGTLYEVTGDDTHSEKGVRIYQNYGKDRCLMQVCLDKIGQPAKISIASDSNDGAYVLPEEGMLAVTKTIEEEQEEGFFYPTECFDFYNNPYKGWVGWADTLEGDVDSILAAHNLIYVDFKWSELEPEKGKFAFDAIEKQYQFEKWQKQGCRMVLRFVMDNPNIADGDPDQQRMDIPEWLYLELEKENAEGEGAGTFYNGDAILELLGGCGFSPNYKSPLLLQYHAEVIKALAERYDDPSVTAYVEVGSLGHWAEFHTWPTGTGEFPDPALAQEYMQAYVDNFHHVRVGIRKPYAVAAENHWGLYNDIFGTTSDGGTPTFLEWAATGNTDMPGSTDEDIAASAMPEWWKENYSGGEFANGDFRTNALNENICAVLDQIRDSHTTWLGPCSACDFKIGDTEYEDFRYNIETMVQTMGYRFCLRSITQTDLTAGTKNDLVMNWENTGVAPIYYNCPLSLLLKDASGNIVYEQIVDTDTTKWLPGRTKVNASLELPADVPAGTYTLAVRMVTDDARKDVIRLAIENEAADGSYDLYSLQVAAAAKPAGTTEQVETDEPEQQKDAGTVEEKNKSHALYWILGAAGAAGIAAAAVILIRKRGKK